jgi:hypothetical protein
MKSFSLIFMLLLLFSCSKQESSTDTAQDATTPPATTPAGRTPVTLTASEIERVSWAIFKKLRDENITEPEVVAFVEEFNVNGDQVHYKLLRHNVANTGWRQMSEEAPEPYAEAQSEEDKAADEAGVSTESDEPTERYGGTPEQFWRYSDEIDTLTYDGGYVAYLEAGTPESLTKTVRIVFRGRLHHENYYEMASSTNDDSPKVPTDYDVNDLLVDLGTPTIVDGDQLYLKAKVAELTAEDLSGMNKSELGYLRNEIFARHGHTFKTNKMVNYFGKKDWYHSLIDDAAPLLNDFEKKNVEFIKKKEG